MPATSPEKNHNTTSTHPPKGSLFCGHCGSRFGITNATGRHGGTYPYFYCLGRQRGKCRQPCIPISTVEQLVEEQWRRVEITHRHKARIRELVVASAQSLTTHGAEQATRQKKTSPISNTNAAPACAPTTTARSPRNSSRRNRPASTVPCPVPARLSPCAKENGETSIGSWTRFSRSARTATPSTAQHPPR
ncbi:zinc ribbon domain-containing protein [Parafrankia sp. FMc6]|uniref:zinc ribbon domain-containing protein n=1 Tax=Parafrankia soli TaxID=2599596 RepID=UPI0034D77A00